MKPIIFKDGVLSLLDQTRLPSETVYNKYTNHYEVADAIKKMIVRGAPAIAVTAGYGLAIGAALIEADEREVFLKEFTKMCELMKGTRPTAVNLFGAVERILYKVQSSNNKTIAELKEIVKNEAALLDSEDINTNRLIGFNGNSLIKNGACIMTHCNAGALATCDYGTALGVIRAAHEAGKNISVIANETRPYLQGARLTCWELIQEHIPVTLICDNMAGHVLKAGKVNCVIVGADRIASNGDTANKIGTYSISVLAREHKVPFYVAAPVTTIDFSLASGELIPIEERSPEEVTHIYGRKIAPEGACVYNPAFDVTPASNITAIITEKGILYPPFTESIASVRP